MDEYMILLRLVHILAAIFWVGAAAVFVLFIEPTAAALGPAAGPFMGHLTANKKLPQVVTIVSATAIVAGALLYWRVSGGLNDAWLQSSMGIGITVGALAAIAAFVVGFTVLRPGVARLGALRARAAGGESSAAAEMERLLHRLRTVGRLNLGALIVAAAAMATARYL